MLNGLVRMLRYRDIRLGKMKFLLPVIGNFFEKFKYINNRADFLKILLHIMVELIEL